MTNNIHPTAIIDDKVVLGENNIIGPYCVLTGSINIGNNNTLKSHVIMDTVGSITIGDDNVFFPFCSLNEPQDKKYAGEKSEIIIGNSNNFREYSTINPGTTCGSMQTIIKDNCLIMVSAHIAHDCFIGNNVILCNSVALAGHVMVGDNAILGGLSAVHQYTRIGAHAMIGGMSAVAGDVVPYGIVVGERAHLAGLNIVGLKRHGFAKEEMHILRHAYEMIFGASNDKNFADRLEMADKEYSHSKSAKIMIDFIAENTKASRALCQPK